MKPQRFDLATLRAALWTLRALWAARRQLRQGGFEGLRLPRVPRVPLAAERGVRGILRRRPHTCLERAVVVQRWRAAHGDPRHVIIGAARGGDTFRAHAWLEHDEEDEHARRSFRELRRLAP